MSQSTPSNPMVCVVVNYNAGPLLRACAESWFKANTGGPLVIVDNASTDGSLDFLSALPPGADVRLLRNSANLGFSVAVNQGLRAATGGMVLLLNPDCVLQKGAVGAMASILRSRPDAGMVGPLLVNPDGSEQQGGRRAVPTPWRSFVKAFGLSRLGGRYPRLFPDFLLHKQPLPEHPVEVEAISGASMLLRPEALDEVGLLDEGYFMHCEDLDWCMRFRQNGWKIMFAPDAVVVHQQGSCSRSRPIFVEWHKHRGMMRFYRKFFRHQYPGILMWAVGMGIWLRFGALVGYYVLKRTGRALGARRD